MCGNKRVQHQAQLFKIFIATQKQDWFKPSRIHPPSFTFDYEFHLWEDSDGALDMGMAWYMYLRAGMIHVFAR